MHCSPDPGEWGWLEPGWVGKKNSPEIIPAPTKRSRLDGCLETIPPHFSFCLASSCSGGLNAAGAGEGEMLSSVLLELAGGFVPLPLVFSAAAFMLDFVCACGAGCLGAPALLASARCLCYCLRGLVVVAVENEV